MYDAIVVGARCAGSPTAMLLARGGYRVLLVDRASFPSDTLSTHYIHQPGVARLRRWGLLDRVAESNAPPVRRQSFDVGPFTLTGAPPPSGTTSEGYAPRRTVLDRILVDAAAAAGAEVREHFTVRELVEEEGRIVGVRGHTAGGAARTERARIVVGADGVRSFVARSVGARAYEDRAPLTCAFYAYWSDVPVEGVELYPRPGRMIIAGPTNDGQTIVISYWPAAEFSAVRADVERSFLSTLRSAPGLAERIRGGHRTERFRGTGHLPFFFRKPFGPGWALVGDASYHKDPLTARGISDAFRDAELLAEAVDAGLSGRRPLDEALADYERRRNAEAMPLYRLTQELASLEPPPQQMLELFAALRDDQEQTDHFFGVIAGTVPVAEFFSPENLARIVGRAAAA